MPLKAEDKMSVGSFGGLTPFYGFDDGVLGATSRDTKTITGNANGLVMAGVDGQPEEAILFGSLFEGEKASQEGVGRDGGGMGYGHSLSGGMVDGHGGEVLHESSSAPDIERLEAEADGKNRLVEVVGVLNKEFVHVFPGGIGWGALGNGLLAVLLGVYVSRAAWEQDRLAGVDEVCDLGGGGLEGNLYGFASRFGYGFGIAGPGSAVVVEVRAGGDGNGYARFHGYLDDTASGHGFARMEAGYGVPEFKGMLWLTLAGVHVGLGDGLIETLGERVRIAGGEAGGEDGFADDDAESTGMEGVDVNGKKLVGADEREGDERNLGLDGHVGASGHHGLEFAGCGSAAFREEDQRETGLQGGDAPIEASYEGAGTFGIDGNLSGTVEVPANEGNLPKLLLCEDAELEGELAEEDRGVHVAEVVAAVDGSLSVGEVLYSNELDGREGDEEEGSCPDVGGGVLLTAGFVP
jgi:hypothetical protein